MVDRPHRLTDQAVRVLAAAQDEAKRLNHEYIGPEHILLGLLQVKDGTAVTVLEHLALDLSAIQQDIEYIVGQGHWQIKDEPSLNLAAQKVIELALDEAHGYGQGQIGSEHLLLGVLRDRGNIASDHLIDAGVTLEAVRVHLSPQDSSQPDLAEDDVIQPLTPDLYYDPPTLDRVPISISPIFGLILMITLGAAYLTYWGQFYPQFTMFVFVTGGWILSLSLHEFGHALAAWWGGDRSVTDKGYLTLNPLKYTHGVLSIFLPLVFLAMGGIGLPGGAVYINMAAIRTKAMQSLISAAGPIATAICALVLLTPFASGLLGPEMIDSHLEFWAGVALLASLQITAFFLVMLPIPGLDGFGIIAPYLPTRILYSLERLGGFTLLIFFLVFFNNTPIGQGFWAAIRFIYAQVNLNEQLVFIGLWLFRWWST